GRNGSFNSVVNLSCVGAMPTGGSCSVSPPSVDLNTVSSGQSLPATVKVTTTNSSTPPGDYSFSFHGEHGGSRRDVPPTPRVNGFTNTSSTGQQTIQQTASGTYTVTVTSLNSYGGTIALSCANFSTAAFSPSSCAFSQNNFVPSASGTNVTVTLTAAANA